MTTYSPTTVQSFFDKYAEDLYWIHCNAERAMQLRLICTERFSDKLERKAEKAGFTIIHWELMGYTNTYDIEIEVAR